MPFYDYACPRCGVFTAARAIRERDHPVHCGLCRRPARRLISAPHLNLMPPTRRQALLRNERSRHEPAVSHRHQGGGERGCVTPRKGQQKSASLTRHVTQLGRLNTSRSSRRPWMLGH